MTGKGRRREEQQEPGLSVSNMGNGPINNYVGTTYKGFLDQAYAWVVKYPYPRMAVWRDDANGVHDG